MTADHQPDAVATVTASGVSHRFGGRPALDRVGFDLHAGTTGLVGANGAGKTTLMRLITGGLRPDEGEIWVFGGDAADTGVLRRVGYMPQELPAPRSLSVTDFLAYMAWLRGLPRRVRAAAIDAALDATDLGDRARCRLGSLSGGMRRRVLLAQALLGDPDLLVLDEPTTGLDPEQRIRVRDLILRAARADRTVLVSSHLMEDVVGTADHVLMLDDGRVVFSGSVDELGRIGAAVVQDGSALSPYEAAFLELRARGGER